MWRTLYVAVYVYVSMFRRYAWCVLQMRGVRYTYLLSGVYCRCVAYIVRICICFVDISGVYCRCLVETSGVYCRCYV